MAKFEINYSKAGIESLPMTHPVVYRIMTRDGYHNYIGSSKKGNVHNRLKVHLREIPGYHVKIEQFHSIKDAKENERNLILRYKPPYNIQYTGGK
jgi:excinuclease UvrABC nuclease subunit